MDWHIFNDILHKVARAMRSVIKSKYIESLDGVIVDVVTLTKTEKDDKAMESVNGCFAFKIDWEKDKAPSTILFALENFHDFIRREWKKRDWLTDEGDIEWCVWYNGKYFGEFRDFKGVTDLVRNELTKPDLKKAYEYNIEESPFVIFLVPKCATDSL